MSKFQATGDGRDWARRIIAKHADGQQVNLYPLRLAREVLGVPKPAPVVRGRPGAARARAPVEPPAPAQAMTPAEAFYAAEQDSVGGYSSAAMARA